MALTENQKKANKLKISWDNNTTDEVLADLIKQKEAQMEQDEEEKKILKEEERLALLAKKKSLILKNIKGEDVDEKDYFYPGEDKNGKAVYTPTWFNAACGTPVVDEDMIEVFKKVFGPAAIDFLFYKAPKMEVYIVIVPLKRARFVGQSEDSIGGDFQKHAISFVADGSVNLDTLKLKLRKIAGFLKNNE